MAAVMFLRKAMRYYRLWIYTCNAVLLVSVLVFIGVGVGVAADPYLALVPVPPPYHPTLIYGYLALLLQAGLLQALGCVGALRLSQRLLNIYWLLLLFLLLGDVLVGLVWLYRFSHLTEGLRPFARDVLTHHYGRDPGVTEAWDSLQRSAACCGVSGPRDYNSTWWEVQQNQPFILLPASCCLLNDSRTSTTRSSHQSDTVVRHVPYQNKASMDANKGYARQEGRASGQFRNLTCTNSSAGREHLYAKGCADYLEKWLLKQAETLMILGFCVIAFIKLCFVGILRFEIQEMIQKIKILQGDTQCAPNPEIAAALGMVSPDRANESSRGLLSTGGGEGEGAGGHDGGGGDPQQDSESRAATPLSQPRLNHLVGHTDGAESDTNSHCALITDTPVRRPQPDKRKPNGNNNDVTELRELRHVRQTQI